MLTMLTLMITIQAFMMNNTALIEIMSSKPHKIRKDWMKDRINKLKGLNVSDKNLRVSKMIDRLNEKLKG